MSNSKRKKRKHCRGKKRKKLVAGPYMQKREKKQKKGVKKP